LDDRKETLNYRIRDGETMKVPYQAIIGPREAGEGTVAVRRRGADVKQVVMARSAFVDRLRDEIATRALT
jgi:threonyl-tRNA synthetase